VPSVPHDQTFTESPGSAAPLVRPEPHLLVVLECDRPLSGSARHSLRGIAEVTLGRGDERAAVRDGERLQISLPGGWMSGAHARISRDAHGWRLEDLGSRNGTWVDGRRVVHLVLADGDVIEAGHTLFVFRDALHAPGGTPLDFDTSATEAPAVGLGTVLPALAGEIDALVRIAASPVPVLLRGETGTGKELVARAVHALSKRTGAFVPVNCGAIPEALVESQLFGHTKGAFSGAVRDEVGFIRAADQGTLFLDEIGDLPLASQTALLRVLQEGEVVPIGTTRPVSVDFRVVAATHQPLEALVARTAFRPDLLARIDGFTYGLPPLRERREDLGFIVRDLLRALAPSAAQRIKLASEVGRALLAYDWPSNIRELGHCLSRGVALVEKEGVLERRHLPPAIAEALETPRPSEGDIETVTDADQGARLRAQVEGLLAEHQGNVAEVARALGKARMQVQRWMKRFGIDPNRYRP
jgi:transcriptional regulator with AAA-type ATPase domain